MGISFGLFPQIHLDSNFDSFQLLFMCNRHNYYTHNMFLNKHYYYIPDIQSYSSFFIGRQFYWNVLFCAMKKSAIERFLRRCVASDNSWFWIYKKQATRVLILVDTVKFKVDTISYESYYHSDSMKTTFLIEINSHQCNEYIIKNYKHQGIWNADSVTSETFRLWHILDNQQKTI